MTQKNSPHTEDLGLAVHFEENDLDVWSGRQLDLDAYIYTCKAFGFTRLAVINTTGKTLLPGDSAFPVHIFSSVEEFLGHTTDRVLWMDLQENVPRASRCRTIGRDPHPACPVWYLFGPAAGWTSGDRTKPRQWCSVPQEGTGALHATHIAAIVAFDRYRWDGR